MRRRKRLEEKLLARLRSSKQYPPPAKRLGAFLIDYVLSSIFISVIPMVITSIVTREKVFTASAFSRMPLAWQVVSGAAALILGAYYFIAYPMKKAHLGQTPGKRLMKLRIAPADGQELTWIHMCRRELIGSMIAEGETAFPSSFFRYFLYMLLPGNTAGWLAAAAAALSAASVLWALFHEKHRMFHDYIGKTVVQGVP